MSPTAYRHARFAARCSSGNSTAGARRSRLKVAGDRALRALRCVAYLSFAATLPLVFTGSVAISRGITGQADVEPVGRRAIYREDGLLRTLAVALVACRSVLSNRATQSLVLFSARQRCCRSCSTLRRAAVASVHPLAVFFLQKRCLLLLKLTRGSPEALRVSPRAIRGWVSGLLVPAARLRCGGTSPYGHATWSTPSAICAATEAQRCLRRQVAVLGDDAVSGRARAPGLSRPSAEVVSLGTPIRWFLTGGAEGGRGALFSSSTPTHAQDIISITVSSRVLKRNAVRGLAVSGAPGWSSCAPGGYFLYTLQPSQEGT